MSTNKAGHIRLTSHPGHRAPGRFPIPWGAPTARERGPVIATVNAARRPQRHRRAWRLLFALPRAGHLVRRAESDRAARPHQHHRRSVEIGPHPQWGEAGKIVSLDPWGHRVAQDFAREIAEGVDIRPTIAITKARLTLPEFATRSPRAG